MSNSENLVYSTDGGRITQERPQPQGGTAYPDGFARIKRQTKGRKGKGVLIIDGLAVDLNELKRIATLLKTKCSTGGAVKDGTIEIQGDQRDRVKAELEKLGFKVKLAGG